MSKVWSMRASLRAMGSLGMTRRADGAAVPYPRWMALVSPSRFLRAAGVVCVLAGAVLVLGSAQRQATPRLDPAGDPAAKLPVGLAAAVSATLGSEEPRFAARALDGR